MSEIRVIQERFIPAPADLVYRLIADFERHCFLPPQFTGYGVEEGGQGAGTVLRFETVWQSAKGFTGLMEHLFAPGMMRRMYADGLGRLEAYAQSQR